MKNISILGLGNISFELCSALLKQGFNVFGSTDNYDRQVRLKKIGVKVFSRSNIDQCILKADKLIITVPPDNFGCKIIKTYSKEIIDSNVRWIGYLSSTSVYGNYNGEEVNELAFALCPSKERWIESSNLGKAFCKNIKENWGYKIDTNLAYPIAVGKAGSYFKIPLEKLLIAFLQSFVSNLINVGIKHIPLGQSEDRKF